MTTISHEYWRFVDNRAAGDQAAELYFYGVFANDGALISQLMLLNNISYDEEPSAVGCPQLGIHPDGEKFINMDVFGGRKAGKPIYVIHLDHFGIRSVHPYVAGMTGIYAIKTHPEKFIQRNATRRSTDYNDFNFVDNMHAIAADRFNVAEAIIEALYTSGAKGKMTSASVHVTNNFWKYFISELKESFEAGEAYIAEETLFRVLRIEKDHGILHEQVRRSCEVIRMTNLAYINFFGKRIRCRHRIVRHLQNHLEIKLSKVNEVTYHVCSSRRF